MHHRFNLVINVLVLFVFYCRGEKSCPPLETTSTTFVQCSNEGNPIDCKAAVSQTKAVYSCAPYHELSTARNVLYCLDGSWDIPRPVCRPVCGQKHETIRQLRQVGNTEGNKYPWTIGIYKFDDFICGGTLITERLIVTTAHCVSDSQGKASDPSFFTLAAGKLYSPINYSKDTYAEYSEIEKIFIPDRYKGSVLDYEADIAVLVTKKAFNTSQHIQRVCVDWDRNSDFENALPGTYGIATGWGNEVNSDKRSKILKEIELPYVDFNQCFKDMPDSFKKFIRSDKMCAGYLNKGIGVCQGDSGGGLVFKNGKDSRYYLRGVVGFTPVSPTGICDGNNYVLSTKISSHLDFLNKIVDQLNSQ